MRRIDKANVQNTTFDLKNFLLLCCCCNWPRCRLVGSGKTVERNERYGCIVRRVIVLCQGEKGAIVAYAIRYKSTVWFGRLDEALAPTAGGGGEVREDKEVIARVDD